MEPAARAGAPGQGRAEGHGGLGGRRGRASHSLEGRARVTLPWRWRETGGGERGKAKG